MTTSAPPADRLWSAMPQRSLPARNRLHSFGFFLTWLLVVAIPWGDMILLPGEVQASRLLTIGVAFTWMLLVWRGRKMVPLRAPFWLMLGFVLWSGVNMIWSPEPERSVRRILSYYQLFLDAWLILQAANSTERYRQLLLGFVLGCYVVIGGLAYNFVLGVQQGDLRYSAPGFDPNDLAVTIVLAIPIAWYLAFQRGSFRWLVLLYVPCAIAASLLTASRAALVVLAIVLLFPLSGLRRPTMRTFLSLMALLLVSFIIVGTFWDDVSFQRLGTISEQLSSRDLNGRVDIWRRGMDVFYENPLFGVGAGALGNAIGARRGRELAAHSTYLGVLVEHGVIGATLFIGIVFSLLAYVTKVPKHEKRLWFIVLFGWAVAVSTLSWENRELTWLIWGLCASCPALLPMHRLRIGGRQYVCRIS